MQLECQLHFRLRAGYEETFESRPASCPCHNMPFVFVGWRGDSRALLHVAHAEDGFERGDALGELALVFGADGDVPHFAAWAR